MKIIRVATFTIISTLVVFLITTDVFAKAIDPGIDRNDYGYETKDKEKQQRKFHEKLVQDKKKVELAISNSKALIDKSRNMPYLPELYLRLAELYIEKARIVFFTRKTETKSKSKSLDNLEANTLKNKAVEVYHRVLNDFPEYDQRDKVRFFLAHEYRELGKISKMVTQYRIIIKKHPDSHYVPEAYLLLGDHFVGKQNLEMALRHYKKVLNYPDSPAIVIARYKLAWGHVNKGDYKKAIKLFELSVKANDLSKEGDVDTYKRVDIKLESLVDMAFCYPDAYKKSTPKQAISYFKKYSWSRQVYAHVLDKLAYRYQIKKKHKHALEIYRELATLRHDAEKKLEYAGSIFESLKELKSYKNADTDMVFIIDALKKQKYSIRIDEKEKQKNVKEFELYARDIATKLHRKAKRSKRPADYKRASDSYKIYLEHFEEESPAYVGLMVNYAETLFASQQYFEAGKQYEKLVKLNKDGLAIAMPLKSSKRNGKGVKANGTLKVKKYKPRTKKKRIDRKELLNSTIVSYYNALKNRDDLNYYQTEFARSGLRTNGTLFVKEFPRSSKVPDILFNIAWITFDAGNYDQAVKEFSGFIKKYPSSKAAESAVLLSMDAFHLREDYEGLVNYGKKITGNKRIARKTRREVALAVKASQAKIVGNLTIDAMNDWELGKQNIEEVVEKNKSTGIGDQALYALLVSGKDKGKLETIFSAGYKHLKYYPKSEHTADVLGIMTDSSISVSQLRVVVKYLEEFSGRLPKHSKTPVFLSQAGKIRKTLGQYERSSGNYERYLKLTPKKSPGRSDVVFALVENYEKMGQTEKSIRILRSDMKSFSRADSVKASALLAELYREQGDYKAAVSYRKRAQKGFTPRLGKADSKLADAMAKMTFNAVHGSYNRFMNTKLGDTIDNKIVEKKSKLLDNLEKGYTSVISLQSPEWVLKACYYSAEINREFAAFLAEAPLPEGFTNDQKKQYQQIISQKTMGYLNKAEEYRNTSVAQAHKWEVINPELISFYADGNNDSGIFDGESSTSEIAEDFLKDEELKKLHYDLYHDSKNSALLMKLAKAYFDRTDYYQAEVLAWKVVDHATDTKSKAEAYKMIGISNLYTGKDISARDALRESIRLNSRDVETRVNLAGMLSHYGHTSAADKLYASLPKKLKVKKSGSEIHPLAKEKYYDAIKRKK